MTSHSPDEDEADDLGDREDPDESDMDSSDEPAMLRCPECGKYVSEDAERCHHCGSYISPADSAARKPKWLIIAAVLVLIACAVFIFRGVFR